MCAFTPISRKIGHTVRSTYVYVRILREADRIHFYRGLHQRIADRTAVGSFRNICFESLDAEILDAASSILRPLKFLHSSAKKLRMYLVVVHIFRNIYFELLYPEISTNIAQNIFYFELLDPEIFTNSTQNIFYFQLPDPEI